MAELGTEEEITQRKALAVTPVQGEADSAPRNNTGLPDSLKASVERLSGLSMDDVKVHYNSGKPAQIQAHAYTQGTEIHVSPGQEQHVPHEAWHVVQQKQGRVEATAQLKGVGLNDDATLETEADTMGARAVSGQCHEPASPWYASSVVQQRSLAAPIQRAVFLRIDSTPVNTTPVYFKKIDDIRRPPLNSIEGVTGSADAARHIISAALIKREFMGRYARQTVQQLSSTFSVPIKADFQANLEEAMWQRLHDEDRARNRTSLPDHTAGRTAGTVSRSQTSDNRNFWRGPQVQNLAKDTASTHSFSMVHTIWRKRFAKRLWRDSYFSSSPGKNALDLYRAEMKDTVLTALAEEFDPPPHASKLELQAMAEQWAICVNSWLTNDKGARTYYWPGRDITWRDAFEFSKGNRAVHDAAT